MQVICDYDDFGIISHNNRFYAASCDNGIEELTLVKMLKPTEYESLEDSELLALCSDYDYSGELDTCSEYCFWRITENQSEKQSAFIRELIAYNGAVDEWYKKGGPEADDELNDSNRAFIKKAEELFPDTACLSLTSGDVFKASESSLCNFCCDYIFDGSLVDTEIITGLIQKFRRTGSTSSLFEIEKLLMHANGCAIVWS